MEKANTIFFDMGNTLLDFHQGDSDDEKDLIGLEYMGEYLKGFNRDITMSLLNEKFYIPWLKGIAPRKTTHREYSIDGFLDEFTKYFGFELDTLEKCKAIGEFYRPYREQLVVNPGALEILKYLKENNYNTGVISNTCYYEEVMKDCFKEAGLYDYIDSFTFSYGIGIGKPEKIIFLRAMANLKTEASDCVMVGDNLKSDIAPALDLGMKAFWYNPEGNENTSGIKPTMEIKRFNTLKNILIGADDFA